ncbi:hypothetical protein E5288_WYG014938 [Bos mutus]|uniref:Uncharacterized protein n=1 Tax=Bos mutus TaxID=72004 RepID=A0A6B0RT71_9CETA|nr:hypothetical protein [Bos mutus]
MSQMPSMGQATAANCPTPEGDRGQSKAAASACKSPVILKINWALSVQRKGLELNDKERQRTEEQQILCIMEASP